MKVKELIQKLQQFDEDLEVIFYSEQDEGDGVVLYATEVNQDTYFGCQGDSIFEWTDLKRAVCLHNMLP